MFSLYKKEIKTFLGSLTGFLAIFVFLLVAGLFLWVFPGVYNIPENGYSTLEGFFNLAPWLYLFLIPAVTMRLFADEKRSGTLEVLLIRPMSDFTIIFSKFFAGISLVILSLIPSLVYFISVWLLGNPVGNLDIGATLGSLLGLFLLAALYVAIGTFSSSVNENQIVSFIFSIVLSFIFYIGFDFIADSGVPDLAELLLSWISINNHYLSLSRGVIDMRDVVYFIVMISVFLFTTRFFIRTRKWRERKTISKSILFYFILLIISFLSTNFLWRADLTSDKRYSVSLLSKEIVSGMDQNIEIELFLAGEMEPGLRKLQQEILEKIAVLNVYSGKPIRIKITNPYAIKTSETRDQFINQIIAKGIRPTSFTKKTEQGETRKYIFPGAIISMNDRAVAANFLKSNPAFSYEANFNHSFESIEYELINAFQKLQRIDKPLIAFLEGNDELNSYEVKDITNALSENFEVTRVLPTEINIHTKKIEILIIAKPRRPFDEAGKLQIDQFIMSGGKVFWLVDPVRVDADSLANGYKTFAFPFDLNLSDQLFRYGVRMNYELLQDVDCARIKVNTALQGTPARFTLHPWYYHPILTPSDNNPVSRNLNGVKTEFVSSIDTIKGNPGVTKQIILTTSPYSRKVKSPSSVSLQNIQNPPARELFSQSFIPAGVILEGKFTSAFKNRLVENLGYQSSELITESKFTKMAVIADGDIIANPVNYSTNPPKIAELGFDRATGLTYGNREFLISIINYLDDKKGIMQLRNRSLKVRLLDKVKLREEKIYWQWFNVVFPLVIISTLVLIYNLLRKRKYTGK